MSGSREYKGAIVKQPGRNETITRLGWREKKHIFLVWLANILQKIYIVIIFIKYLYTRFQKHWLNVWN